MINYELIKAWFQNDMLKFIKPGIKYNIIQTPEHIEKRSIRVELETQKYIARLTIWESGEIYKEVIDINTENTILDEYVQIENNDEISGVSKTFFDIIN